MSRNRALIPKSASSESCGREKRGTRHAFFEERNRARRDCRTAGAVARRLVRRRRRVEARARQSRRSAARKAAFQVSGALARRVEQRALRPVGNGGGWIS